MSTGKVYDLKVGYHCNNKCFHCVIEPNRLMCVQNGTKQDMKYQEIVTCINSSEFSEAESVVITGGEPTIRPDFLRILRYIMAKYPKIRISLQTNGRELKKYLNAIVDGNITLNYVVALHGFEETHNKIADGCTGNPFKETWESIQLMKELYGDFNKAARIEIVLSKLNLFEIPDFISFLISQDILRIGLSYPHLDGFAYILNYSEAAKRGFSYSELKKILPEICEIALKNKGVELYFEEVPRCMWRDGTGKLLKLPHNISSMDHNLNENIAVKFPDSAVNSSFLKAYTSSHKMPGVCQSCVYCCSCIGVWAEAVDIYGSEGFIPVVISEEALDVSYKP